MARTRSIKPGFFDNDTIGDLPPLTRLLFIGLWCIADREGRLQDRPRRIKKALLGYDDVDADGVDKMLWILHNAGFLQRYTINGEQYIQVLNFCKHQNPHVKEKPSEIPPPQGTRQAPGKHQASMEQAALVPGTLLLVPGTRSPSTARATDTDDEPQESQTTEQSEPQHGESLTVTQHGESQKKPKTAGPAAGNEAREQPSTTLAAKRFEEFWAAYPRKVGKKAAEVTFKKIRPDGELHDRIITAVNSAKKTDQWIREGGRFIPNPATWLNQGRWDDEYEEEVQNGAGSRHSAAQSRASPAAVRPGFRPSAANWEAEGDRI